MQFLHNVPNLIYHLNLLVPERQETHVEVVLVFMDLCIREKRDRISFTLPGKLTLHRNLKNIEVLLKRNKWEHVIK